MKTGAVRFQNDRIKANKGIIKVVHMTYVLYFKSSKVK